MFPSCPCLIPPSAHEDRKERRVHQPWEAQGPWCLDGWQKGPKVFCLVACNISYFFLGGSWIKPPNICWCIFLRPWIIEVGLVHPWERPWFSWGMAQGEVCCQVLLWRDRHFTSTFWQAHEQDHGFSKQWFVLPLTLEWQWLTGFYPWFSPVRARVYRVFYDRSKWKWVGPSLRHMLKLFCPLMQLRMTTDDLYFLTKTELVLVQCWETSLVCVLCFFCGFTS